MSRTILVVGATGSIGRVVVHEAESQGLTVRALVRDETRADDLRAHADLVVGDLTDASTLVAAVEGIDAVVFTHGARPATAENAERVDYGAVRSILQALGGRPATIVLMTAIGVTVRTPAHDWKRRGERLVRASGRPYAIVRPGWFDYNEPDQQRVVLLQGDQRRAGDPSDGVVARQQIAEVLVASTATTGRHTFELVAEGGAPRTDVLRLIDHLDADPIDAVDGVHDPSAPPPTEEPTRVRDDLAALPTLEGES